MTVKHKTSTYMGFPNHSFLWTQWTSETMSLRTGEEGDDGMDARKERNKTKIKQTSQIKWDRHDSTQKKGMPTFVSFFLPVMH